MNDKKDDFVLNDPSVFAEKKVPDEEIANHSSDDELANISGHRAGEFEPGIPEPQNPDARPMRSDEKGMYEQLDLQEEQKRIDALVDQVLKDASGFRLPESLRKTIMWGAIGVAAVLLLLVIGQVTSFLVQLQSLKLWSQWVIGSLLSAVVLVILYLVVKLTMLYQRLQKNEQINLKAVSALNEREALQQLANQKKTEAVQQLKDYLDGFPVDQQDKLLRIGLNSHEIAELKNSCSTLLNEDGIDTSRWLTSYQSGFQSVLDQAAERCVKAYAVKTSIKTAISPLPLLDNTIVLTLSLSMVRDLMILYNLRMTTAGAGQILLRAIGQAYIAGELQSLTESFVESLSSIATENVGQISARVGKAVGSKAGEGVANGIMMYRLGRATSKLLQPCNG